MPIYYVYTVPARLLGRPYWRSVIIAVGVFQGSFETEPTNPKLIELQEILISDGVDNIFPHLDGTAFYKTICKINHSCCPNCIVKYTSDPVHGFGADIGVWVGVFQTFE